MEQLPCLNKQNKKESLQWKSKTEQFPHRSFFQGPPQRRNVIDRTPHLGDQTLVSNVETTQVQDVVDGFHLLDLDDPRVDGFWGFNQDLFQVVLCPVKYLHTVRDKQDFYQGLQTFKKPFVLDINTQK